MLNSIGRRASTIPASSGVRSDLRLLQGLQAHTRFVKTLAPPRDAGITWSLVNSLDGNSFKQYWQRDPSLRTRARLVTARVILGMYRYSVSRTTDGAGQLSFAERTTAVGWLSITDAAPLKMSVSVSLTLLTRTGSKQALRTNTGDVSTSPLRYTPRAERRLCLVGIQ